MLGLDQQWVKSLIATLLRIEKMRKELVFFFAQLIADAEIEIIEGGEKPMSMGPEYRGLEDLMIAT